MSIQEILFIGLGITCAVVIMASFIITAFWAIFDCAMSEEYPKDTKLKWLLLLFIGNAVFVPSFIYGRYITKSSRLRHFTRGAFIAILISAATIFSATIVGQKLNLSSGSSRQKWTNSSAMPRRNR